MSITLETLKCLYVLLLCWLWQLVFRSRQALTQACSAIVLPAVAHATLHQAVVAKLLCLLVVAKSQCHLVAVKSLCLLVILAAIHAVLKKRVGLFAKLKAKRGCQVFLAAIHVVLLAAAKLLLLAVAKWLHLLAVVKSLLQLVVDALCLLLAVVVKSLLLAAIQLHAAIHALLHARSLDFSLS